ncbi:hypothetical protein [Streptomyces sp. NPDC058249]|uniref:hypothetical protein n=1 Tax=Streptomyces sp. NPDC058249 TaxID=3346403 RepID=UPI0036EC5562
MSPQGLTPTPRQLSASASSLAPTGVGPLILANASRPAIARALPQGLTNAGSQRRTRAPPQYPMSATPLGLTGETSQGERTRHVDLRMRNSGHRTQPV